MTRHVGETAGVPEEEIASAKERAWRELAAIDRALERGDIDDDGWHAAVLALIEPAYLGANTPQAGSGHSGDAHRWERARRLLTDALDVDGAFLDIGCANGLLRESIALWAAAADVHVEPHGVEISPSLADLARARSPQWADRIWTANAHRWHPPKRFAYVRTGLDYVPPGSAPAYVAHLMAEVVAPDGRLVIGVHTRNPRADTIATAVRTWGYDVAGATARPHRNPRLAYKALWIDGPRR